MITSNNLRSNEGVHNLDLDPISTPRYCSAFVHMFHWFVHLSYSNKGQNYPKYNVLFAEAKNECFMKNILTVAVKKLLNFLFQMKCKEHINSSGEKFVKIFKCCIPRPLPIQGIVKFHIIVEFIFNSHNTYYFIHDFAYPLCMTRIAYNWNNNFRVRYYLDILHSN